MHGKNSLVYIDNYPPGAATSRQYIPTNIVEIARLLIAKLTYGSDIVMARFPYQTGIIYIPDKFISKSVNRVIEWEEMSEMMNGFDLSRFKIFDASNYSVIYFDQYIEKTPYIGDRDIYVGELNKIFHILVRYFPGEKIARKYHPNGLGDKDMIRVGDVIPDFVPAEFLYNEGTKVYLGFTSAALANVEKGIAISLLDLVNIKTQKLREQLRELVKGLSRSEIIFPKSLEEFEQVLSGMAEVIN